MHQWQDFSYYYKWNYLYFQILLPSHSNSCVLSCRPCCCLQERAEQNYLNGTTVKPENKGNSNFNYDLTISFPKTAMVHKGR